MCLENGKLMKFEETKSKYDGINGQWCKLTVFIRDAQLVKNIFCEFALNNFHYLMFLIN
jgi:hypothetical protein